MAAKRKSEAARALPSDSGAASAQVAETPIAQAAEDTVYIVGATPVSHNGEFFAPGQAVVLTDSQAQRLALYVTQK